MMVSAALWVDVSDTLGAQPSRKASNQRAAHKHHLSPGLSPSKPNSGRGVVRSLPLFLEKLKFPLTHKQSSYKKSKIFDK